MHLPSAVSAKIREGFVLYAAGNLAKDSPLYEVIHVSNFYYNGNTDLAQAMLLRDIERNYQMQGVYKSRFSCSKYECCERAREKAGLCKVIARLVASFGRSEYVTLTFS